MAQRRLMKPPVESLRFFGLNISPMIQWYNDTCLFIESLLEAMWYNLCGNLYSIVKMQYNLVYSAVRYWLLHGPSSPIFRGYEGMEEADICASMKNLPASHFVDGSAKELCEEAIHQEITSRTTVLLTVMITIFLMFGIPRLLDGLCFIFTLRNRLRKEEADREERRFWRENERRKEDERKERNEARAAKKKITDDTNTVIKNVFRQWGTILAMNDLNANGKICEMRAAMDHIFREKYNKVHYRNVIDELRWAPKVWRITDGSPTENIIHQLENSITRDMNAGVAESEDDDDM